MAVRELRKTETTNVSVFYLSFCSTIGAICGCWGPKLWGLEDTVRLPFNNTEWLLLLAVGKLPALSKPTTRNSILATTVLLISMEYFALSESSCLSFASK